MKDLDLPWLEMALRSLPEGTQSLLGEAVQHLIQQNASLQQQVELLEQQVGIDALTGLYNKGRFEKDLLEQVSAFERLLDSQRGVVPKESLGLIYGDIDLFKSINDANESHLYGDTVLRDVAAVLRKEARLHERVYRVGGDEFALILPPSIAEHGLELANRMKENVEQLPDVTMSFGVALYQRESPVKSRQDLNEAVKRFRTQADTALYQAKELGRNQVVLYQEQV